MFNRWLQWTPERFLVRADWWQYVFTKVDKNVMTQSIHSCNNTEPTHTAWNVWAINCCTLIRLVLLIRWRDNCFFVKAVAQTAVRSFWKACRIYSRMNTAAAAECLCGCRLQSRLLSRGRRGDGRFYTPHVVSDDHQAHTRRIKSRNWTKRK